MKMEIAKEKMEEKDKKLNKFFGIIDIKDKIKNFRNEYSIQEDIVSDETLTIYLNQFKNDNNKVFQALMNNLYGVK